MNTKRSLQFFGKSINCLVYCIGWMTILDYYGRFIRYGQEHWPLVFSAVGGACAIVVLVWLIWKYCWLLKAAWKGELP
jgi:hypothetical protein